MASALARLATLDERNRLLEEENRWLKAQLFGRSSEKTPLEERNPDQAWLFNEIEALAQFSPDAPETITIPAHDRVRRGRKKLAADIPRVEVVHDLSEAEKVCPADGTTLERIGEETCEQLGSSRPRSGSSSTFDPSTLARAAIRLCGSRRCPRHCFPRAS
jgi:transposase